MRIFTGMRWTTFTKLPTAFSGGSRLMREPVLPAMESTRPLRVAPFMSTLTSTSWPGRMRAIWVSLKFAVTQVWCRGMRVSRP